MSLWHFPEKYQPRANMDAMPIAVICSFGIAETPWQDSDNIHRMAGILAGFLVGIIAVIFHRSFPVTSLPISAFIGGAGVVTLVLKFLLKHHLTRQGCGKFGFKAFLQEIAVI